MWQFHVGDTFTLTWTRTETQRCIGVNNFHSRRARFKQPHTAELLTGSIWSTYVSESDGRGAAGFPNSTTELFFLRARDVLKVKLQTRDNIL